MEREWGGGGGPPAFLRGEVYRKLVLFLQTSLEISGDLREFSGECNLGVQFPLTTAPPAFSARGGVHQADGRGACDVMSCHVKLRHVM